MPKNNFIMKKLIYFCILIVCFSCKPTEPPVLTHDFKKQLRGEYKILSANIDIPLDLNFDGEANTDLFREITCITTWDNTGLDNLQKSIIKIVWQNYSYFVDIWTTLFYSHLQTTNDIGCYHLTNRGLYKVEVNEQTKTIIIPKIVECDDCGYWEYNYNDDGFSGGSSIGRLDSVIYKNDTLTLYYMKKYPITPDLNPEYATTQMCLIYEKIK